MTVALLKQWACSRSTKDSCHLKLHTIILKDNEEHLIYSLLSNCVTPGNSLDASEVALTIRIQSQGGCEDEIKQDHVEHHANCRELSKRWLLLMCNSSETI